MNLAILSALFSNIRGIVAGPVLRLLLAIRDAIFVLYQQAGARTVRGVVASNIADLTAFTVATHDGLTFAEGDRVLLALQTTAAQCGLYVVGAVDAGSAALTRVPDAPAGKRLLTGSRVYVAEGTIWGGTEWFVTAAGNPVIGTTDPAFYPAIQKAKITLVAGTKALGATENLFLLSTTKSKVQITRNTPNTTTNTVEYYCAESTRTAGKSGTAALTVEAAVAAGTINNADVSTLDVTIFD